MGRIGTPLDTDDRFPSLSLALVARGAFDPLALRMPRVYGLDARETIGVLDYLTKKRA